MKFFQPITRVVENSTIRITAARRQKMLNHSVKAKTFCNKPTYYGILHQNDKNEWRVADQYGTDQIPCGVYTFIRTTTGFIRVAPAPQGTTNHLEVANYAAEVRYAGEISFNSQGKMLSWNNKSGGYRPDFHQASQAGLPLDIFSPVSRDTQSTALPCNPINPKNDESTVNYKRKLSSLAYIKDAYNQSCIEDDFAQLRAKMRKNLVLVNDQSIEREVTVKCVC